MCEINMKIAFRLSLLVLEAVTICLFKFQHPNVLKKFVFKLALGAITLFTYNQVVVVYFKFTEFQT